MITPPTPTWSPLDFLVCLWYHTTRTHTALPCDSQVPIPNSTPVFPNTSPPRPHTPPLAFHKSDPLLKAAIVTHRYLLTVRLVDSFICSRQQLTISATSNQSHPTAVLPITYTINGFLVDISLQWPMISIIAAYLRVCTPLPLLQRLPNYVRLDFWNIKNEASASSS